jgi:hypothetical protein
MKAKPEQSIAVFIVIIAIIGISTMLGNYAAVQVVGQTVVKNAMLCQILFLAGIVAGCAIVLAFQAWERARDQQS